jgi:23S rRNA pseudouridine2457 synthase
VLIAFHKPYAVLSQFTETPSGHTTLAEFGFPKNVYPLGRLDWDSEGILLLSDEKELNARLLNPRFSHERTYHAQVDGTATQEAMERLCRGIVIQDWKTKPCKARLLENPGYPERSVPIRFRKEIPTSWIELKISEGKNRQVRKMTAAVGFPTLRLIRAGIGKFSIGSVTLGKWKELGEAERKAVFE